MNNLTISSLSSSIKKIWYFWFSKQKYKVIALIFIMFLTGIIPAIDGILLQKITDLIESFTTNEVANLPQALVMWIVIYPIWWQIISITWHIYDYVYLSTLPKIKAQVMDEFYDYIQYHSHEFFQNNLAGDLTTRIKESARSLEMIFAYFNEKILRKLSVLIFSVTTLYTVHSTIGNIFLIWMLIFLSTSIYFARTINHYSTIYGISKAVVSGKIVDAFANISVIRMFASHKRERKYLNKYTNDTIICDQNMQRFMLKLRIAFGISCTIMIFAIMYYIITLRSNSVISTGDCILVITLCIAVIDDVLDLAQELGDLFEEIGAFNQTMPLLGKYEICNKKQAITLEIKKPIIEFKNVSFAYRNNNNSFTNKSVTINPTQKVGLVGFSGSGKTTFASLIARLFEISNGKILIDGQDIAEVTQSSLRQNISYIPQEPILFHRSIRENIIYGSLGKANEEEIIKVAKAAYIHEHIMSMPKGYDTICGERGNNLSGGQRQRLIIARAMLKNAPIIILDEPTSSLDSYTEKMIQQSLEILMAEKTVLVIAHRLNTLLNMDRLLIFDKGHIVGDGTHDELKEKCKIYKKLWESQIAGIL